MVDSLDRLKIARFRLANFIVLERNVVANDFKITMFSNFHALIMIDLECLVLKKL